MRVVSHSTADDLRSAVNENFEGSFRTLAAHSPKGATKQFGSVTAVSVGVPTPVFNRMFVFEPPEPEDVMAAMTWLHEREVPYWITADTEHMAVVDAAVAEWETESSEKTQPGMAHTGLDEICREGSVADITVATDAAGLDDWAMVAEDVFEFSPATTNQLTPTAVLTDDQLAFFIGRVNGSPAACGLLVRSGDVAGVYTIGVRKGFRRRGIGDAMTRAALATGRDLGCRVGVLQSSEMGVPLYEQMGFQTVVEYSHWRVTIE